MCARRKTWFGVCSSRSGKSVTGARIRATVVKNKVAPPFRKAEFDIMFGEGISRAGDVLDLAVDRGIVEKSGAWYSHGENRLGQGRERVRNFLKENPDILEEIATGVLRASGLLESGEDAISASDE